MPANTPAIPEPLRQVREQLDRGEAPAVKVRQLLDWFQRLRRDSHAVSRIRAAFRELDLATSPNFEDAWIGEELRFSYATPRPAPEPVPLPPDASPEASLPDTSPVTAADRSLAGPTLVAQHTPAPAEEAPPAPEVTELHTRHDPVLRIGKLEAANHPPESVHLDTTLNEAISRMMRWDFGQLPVLSNPYRVEGAITWKSIASSYTLRSEPPQRVRDCLDYAPVCRPDDSIFEALPEIVLHGFTLVQGKRGVQGLVTLSDVTSEFRGSLEPFVLIGEIERHLRQLLDWKLPLELLRSVKQDGNKDVHSAADLSFGQYLRLLERPEVWELCGLRVDRKQFVKDLEQARTLRNEIMHFQREAVSDKALQETRGFAVFLRQIIA